MKLGKIDQGNVNNLWQVCYDSNELAEAVASITISNLLGNTDEEYQLICRFVDDDTTGGYYLRFNNDSGTNYGYQYVDGTASTASALRDTSEAQIYLGYTNTDGKICFSKHLIYAKSGYLRTVLSESAEDISGTTVTNIKALGQVWSNTADEITSMVIGALNDKINIGSRIILLKKVKLTTGLKTGDLNIQGSIRGTWEKIYDSGELILKELDYMKYSSNSSAQSAYVTDATYGSDILTGGTASASGYYSTYVPANACDNNEATVWYAEPVTSANPNWWKYDLGSGVTKIVQKLRLKSWVISGGNTGIKNFILQGSNNNSDWTDIYSGLDTNDTNWQDHTFANSTAYRYYRIYFSDSYYGLAPDQWQNAIAETEMMEISLQSYSEPTIKTQGSYSLKGMAAQTDSLNDTLTKTVNPVINLTGINTLKFDIRASRTGSNIKIGIHDSGGTTTEITPNILVAGTFQTVTWDISGVSDVNKDAIDQIIITIVNADAINTFYIDNFYMDISGTERGTSITISDLDGNSDVIYRLRLRAVNNYNGAITYQLRPNNDAGTNYGYQRLYGESTAVGASRNTSLNQMHLGNATAQNNLSFSETILYAKSGKVRTAITELIKTITGTTCTSIHLKGQIWNNSADNITSLVIFGDQANGLGIGSYICLEKLVL